MTEKRRERAGPAFGTAAHSTLSDRSRRTLPFLGAVVATLGLAALAPGDSPDLALLGLAATAFVACAALTAGVPWERAPGVTRAAPLLLFCAGVALARESSGGGRSGFAVLLVLAIVWQAAYGRRRALAGTILAVTATMVLPILLLGDPAYPSSEWRRSIVLAVVGTVVGAVVQRLVRDLRRERALVATVARLGRSVAAGEDPRHSLCQATLELTGAHTALLFEPDGGGLRVTQAAGLALPPLTIPDARLPDALRGAWATDEVRTVIDGPDGHEAPVPEARRMRSWVHRPASRDGVVRVVLTVGWAGSHVRPRATVLAALELLAAEAAAAIDRADLLERLDRMARHDALTGLVNRRAWDELLEREVTRSARSERPLSVAIVDLDHFKAFNDLHGHLVGDQLLKSAAGAWATALRKTDVLCRWGGEEFAILMPDTPAAEARRAIERMAAHTPMRQTLSAGFVTHTGRIAPESLMAGADQAVYRAKRAGRDRVEEGDPPPPITLSEPIALDAT